MKPHVLKVGFPADSSVLECTECGAFKSIWTEYKLMIIIGEPSYLNKNWFEASDDCELEQVRRILSE